MGKANTIRRSVIFLCFNFLEPLSYCRYFILQVVKIFFEKMVCFNAKFGYLILNCQETISWLLDKRRENQGNCGCCQKAGCYVCNRFNYIKTELQKNAFFEKQDWPHQPVLWQIHDNFNKEPNKYDKNIYRFRIYIERTVKSDYLIQKYDFVNDVILEIH